MPDPSSAEPTPLPRPFCSLLVVYNGTTAGGKGKSAAIGGGDQVILKFIRLSGFSPDMIVPRSARDLVKPHGQLHLTVANKGSGLGAMLWLYLIRTIQGLWRAWRLPQAYDVALGVSAIAVDLLPLWMVRARHKGVIIYHLLPKRKAVNWPTRFRFGLAALEHMVAMRLVGWMCTFIVAGNAHTKSQLQARFPRKNVVILHAGFDANAIDRTPAEERDPNLACFMGRLTSQKGIFDLLTVMEQIHQVQPDFKLVLVGDGPDRFALQNAIDQRKIASVRILGFVSDSEKYGWLKRAGFFFFPSYEEGWGIALAEALYCGAHCICYELPHYRDVFGEYPAYARIGDTEHFTKLFLERRHQPVPAEQSRFLRQYHDPQVVRQLAAYLADLPQSPPASAKTPG